MFTRYRNFSLSWVRWIQYTPPHPISLRYILILSTYLHLGPPSGLFWLSHQYPKRFLFFSMRATYPAHSSSFTWSFLFFWQGVKSCSSSLCTCSQPPNISSLFDQNILLSTLFSHSLSLCSSISVRDQDSHSYNSVAASVGAVRLAIAILTINVKKNSDLPLGTWGLPCARWQHRYNPVAVAPRMPALTRWHVCGTDLAHQTYKKNGSYSFAIRCPPHPPKERR
jgi:hypothetical protein